MSSFEKSFHLEFAQVAECTSQKLSGESSALYFDQPLAAPRNGTRREENAKGRLGSQSDLWLSALSITSLLLVLLMTACGPRGARLQSSEEAPDETPLIVLSGGGSTSPGQVSEELDGANLPIEAPTKSTQEFGLDRLRAFSKEPAVSERVRLVLGWLEFFRNQTILPDVKTAWSELQANNENAAPLLSEPIPEKEIEAAKVSQMEFRLWRELLRSSAKTVEQGTEPASDALSRLDRLALILAAAERPEDLQDLDRWLLGK